MAGTVTCTETSGGGLRKVVYDWLSSSDSVATSTSTGVYNGRVVWVIMTPDSGDTQPDASYDVVLNDADGYDLLNGGGANLSNSASVYKAEKDGLGYCHSSTLSLSVSGTGEANGGIVTVYIQTINNPG